MLFVEANYEMKVDLIPSRDGYAPTSFTSDIFIAGDVRRSFEPPIDWDLENIASDCANWICEDDIPVPNSRVWILSSRDAEHLLSPLLDRELCRALRLMMETSSILHNWGSDANFSPYSAADLWKIRSSAGSQVLRRLDAALSLTKLANASHDELKATFLALFGAVISVGYTDSRYHEVN